MSFKVYVRFAKTFVKGTLKGITVRGSLSFPNIRSAEAWLNGINRATLNGSVDYSLSEIYFDKELV